MPVVIGACGWQDIKWLGKIAAVPRKGANIASWEANPAWKTIDDAWMHVYNEVKEMIVSYQKNKA
ncbi:hypothetical protein ACQ86N_40950 [Puia sp. P3]|uniref:hypothetical protein n=1 Tax=Puia sp. P3 TaxID=3423952 RepID=UPI003D67FEC4